ncbi:MAG: hypothetical protein KAU94_09445, partial [Verrucomicrobia bacterium]|nr:hypothetical protein [Verrucomicrobiota bacterium]
MKTHCFKFIALSIFLFGTAHARAELHEFTLKDGRTLKAEIVGYNAKLGKVELKRADGKRVPVKPAVFVEADQKYIKEWTILDGVRNERFFKVACKKVMAEKWKKEEEDEVQYDDGSSERVLVSISKFKRYVYELNLENRNDFAVENLKLEYRVFYEQEVSTGSAKVVAKDKVLSGSLEVKRMGPREKKKLTTEPVVLRDTEYSSDITYGESGITRERESSEIKGFCLRIIATGSDGQTVLREIFE